MKLVGAIAVDAKVVKMPNQRLAVGYIGSKPSIFQSNGPFKLLCTMGGEQTFAAISTIGRFGRRLVEKPFASIQICKPRYATARGTGDTATAMETKVASGENRPLKPATSMMPPPPPMTELPGVFTASASATYR